jgi:WAS/WASL-interacting protein
MRARQPTLLGMTAPKSPPAAGADASAQPLWAVDSGGAGEDRELDEEQIAREIASGKLAPSTLVWREGFGDWLEIANVPQLAQHLPGAKKPAGLPPRAAAKSAPLNPSPAAKPQSSPLNPTPGAKPASAPIHRAPGAKSSPLNPAPAQPAPALPKSPGLGAKTPAAAPKASAAKPAEPRAPQRSAPMIDPPQPTKIDLGLEDDDDSTMIYRAPTDLVAKLNAEEKAAAPTPAAGRPALPRPGSAPKAAPSPPAPPPPPPLPAAPPPRAAPPPPSKSATVSPLPAAPALAAATPVPTFSDPGPAPAISSEPQPPLPSAQPFPVHSPQAIPTRPLDPSIPIKGLEFPPAPRVPQGALPAQGAAPFGAPTPGVTPTNAPPGMGMLAPNPFATLPTTTDLDFPAKRSKLPYVIAALLGLAAVGGVVAVIMSSKAPPPPVPVPVAVPTATTTSAARAAQTATGTTTDTTAPSGAPDPIANPNGAPGPSGSGNFSQMFAAGVESAQKNGGTVASATTSFDAEAAKRAVLAQLTRVAACKEAGSPVGQTSAAITFEPSGKVSAVTVGAPFAGTSTGTCMVAVFKDVQVAPFTGLPATVSQIVSLR